MSASLGGVEAGGSKCVCVVGEADGTIHRRERFSTRDPASTLADVVGFFDAHLAAGGTLDAIGVASFGPLELRRDASTYGHVGVTPKLGWSHADLLGPLRAFDVPLELDTDVNGAALAEGRWGAARDCDQFAYITVGTGIGGGVVVAGRPLHGLVHPEIGHMAVPRLAGDDYPGLCPFHHDCLEGMAGGPAVAARWGKPAEELQGTELVRAVELEAAYLAAGIRNIVYALAPQRVIVGGGLSALPGLIGAVRTHLASQLAGYPDIAEQGGDAFVVVAGLGDDAGPKGALALASLAAG